MTSAIVCSNKRIKLRTDGHHGSTRHIDVGYLFHVDARRVLLIDVFSQVLQVGTCSHLIRLSLSTLTHSGYARTGEHWCHDEFEALTRNLTLTDAMEEDGHLPAAAGQYADVGSDA